MTLLPIGAAVAVAGQAPAKLPEGGGTPYESVLKTLIVDERKVLEVLTKNNGQVPAEVHPQRVRT
jgi:hypothetical protein